MTIKKILLASSLIISIVSLNCQATERDLNGPDREMLNLEAMQCSWLHNGINTESHSKNLINKKELFFKSRISLLLEKKQFNAAFDIPTIIRTYVESNTAQFIINNRTYFDRRPQINEMIQNLEVYLDLETPNCYKNLITDKKYSAATAIAKVYRTRNLGQSMAWLEEISTDAAKEIKQIAHTIYALKLTKSRDLQTIYEKKGIAFIESFPEGDSIRIRLQAHYNKIANAHITEIPNEEIIRLKVVRDMADQLFPEGD